MRVLGLDVGTKKIGVAMSDSTQSIAQGLKVYRRTCLKDDLEEVKRLAEEHTITEIVIGLPKDLSGTVGKKAQEVMAFAEQVERYTQIPIVLWDERFSTNEANRVFELAQVNHKKRKPFIDMIASQIILQGYLDARQTK
ncbi:MAG: putative Holliday junction resolvase [Syntrophorhabdus sp. PtaU1.Bin002]|nr:MAG: putative Holliday junction resolvase [Syntrophorhabdus sp. PtaB.Bin006]OPY66423.1 MAG: putative Holliday junction resolvase [Syntrophorhabdus sp. PtaU1.Bin002]